ncbi:MAG: iron-sulfur cluster assembly scaffold protein [Gammaproteobacteria bacterium]|nr:iron-sulfur cluster assembly scaffold protein [Gammaproteobacteria bacterium]
MNENELQALYAQVLRLADDIPRNQRLEQPDASVRMVSPLCGSQVTVDLVVRDGLIQDYGQKVRACTLGAAAAAIVGKHIVGRPTTELRELRDRMRAMLKDEGPPPQGVWAELEILTPARDLVSRHGSIMLAFDAVVAALDEIEGRDREPTDKASGIPETVRA